MKIKKISIKTKNRKYEMVKIALYQPFLDKDFFHKDITGIFKLRHDSQIYKDNFENVINKSLAYDVDILIYPELFMNKSFITKIRDQIKNSEIIIIGGSYYDTKGVDSIINVSPIITCKDILYTEKINPSLFDRLPFSSELTIKPGEEILFVESNYGNFIVLICRDFLEKSILEEIDNFLISNDEQLDFIFVPSANPKYEAFHSKINKYIDGRGLYINYCNLIGNITDNIFYDGKSAIFAHMHKKFIEDLTINKYKPKDNYGYKICELKEYEKLLIVKYDLNKKGLFFKDTKEPNIEILYPKREPIRIAIRHDQIIYSVLKDLQTELEVFKNKDIIFNTIRKYLDETDKNQMVIPIDKILNNILSEVNIFINETFDNLFESKLKDKIMRKVINWEDIYDPDPNLYSKLSAQDKDSVIKLCKEITREFPEISPKLNVISAALFEGGKVEQITITGRNIDKTKIDYQDLVTVKEMDGKSYYNNIKNIGPSSETAINYMIHKLTLKKFVIHLNTKEIEEFAWKNVRHEYFYRKEKIPLLDNDGKLIFIIYTEEDAFGVDIIELAEKISALFKTGKLDNYDIEKVIVLGKNHAIWFVGDNVHELIERSIKINKEIGKLINLYK